MRRAPAVTIQCRARAHIGETPGDALRSKHVAWSPVPRQQSALASFADLDGSRTARALPLSSAPPSPGLRRLLETKLDTFEKLELVIVLRDCPDQTCTLGELARQLQVGPDVLRRVAAEVVRTGLMVYGDDDQLRLAAGTDELALIAEGAERYRKDRNEVIALLSSVALDRIRSMAARSFADAFTIRKKKDEDG